MPICSLNLKRLLKPFTHQKKMKGQSPLVEDETERAKKSAELDIKAQSNPKEDKLVFSGSSGSGEAKLTASARYLHPSRFESSAIKSIPPPDSEFDAEFERIIEDGLRRYRAMDRTPIPYKLQKKYSPETQK